MPRGFVVTWDGLNEDGTDIQPLDWKALEVNIQVGGLFVPTPETVKGTIETPQGGTYTFGAGIEFDPQIRSDYTVIFVARNTSGIASLPSIAANVSLGQVEGYDVADFALTVRKFTSLRHEIY